MVIFGSLLLCPYKTPSIALLEVNCGLEDGVMIKKN